MRSLCDKIPYERLSIIVSVILDLHGKFEGENSRIIFTLSASDIANYFIEDIFKKINSEEEKYHKISNYYRKMQMIFDSLSKKVKKESDQKILEQNRLDLEILNSFYHREYKKTLDLIEKNTVDSLLKRVLFAKLEAKSYYYLKDTSKAKEKLEFIIEKGNTMFVVEQAKEMLKEF